MRRVTLTLEEFDTLLDYIFYLEDFLERPDYADSKEGRAARQIIRRIGRSKK